MEYAYLYIYAKIICITDNLSLKFIIPVVYLPAYQLFFNRIEK